jgi:hypothetical protein
VKGIPAFFLMYLRKAVAVLSVSTANCTLSKIFGPLANVMIHDDIYSLQVIKSF